MTSARKYEILVEYLKMKVEVRDWHGVADAAMDIRELIAKCPDVEDSTKQNISILTL